MNIKFQNFLSKKKIPPTVQFRKTLSIGSRVICTDGQTDRTNSAVVRFFAIVLPRLLCFAPFHNAARQNVSFFYPFKNNVTCFLRHAENCGN